MPGRWQRAVLDILRHESPLKLREILLRAGTGSHHSSAQQSCKRAVTSLCAQGLVARWRHGVYGMVLRPPRKKGVP